MTLLFIYLVGIPLYFFLLHLFLGKEAVDYYFLWFVWFLVVFLVVVLGVIGLTLGTCAELGQYIHSKITKED